MSNNGRERWGPFLGVAGLLLGTPVFVVMLIVAYAAVFIVGWPWILAGATGVIAAMVRAIPRTQSMSLARAVAAWLVVTQAALLAMVAIVVAGGTLMS